MPDENDDKHKVSRLWRRPTKWYYFGIPLGGFLCVAAGIVIWAGFTSVVEATSKTGFCLSCHAMEAYAYTEYQESWHYQNRAGIRAECKDCHVPEPFVPKMAAKIKATFVEVPNHIRGKINTEEKFNAHREVMAQRVWDRMQTTDSRECRSCHTYEAMDLSVQDRQARRRHSSDYLEATGRTCIDCHRGVAHRLPDTDGS